MTASTPYNAVPLPHLNGAPALIPSHGELETGMISRSLLRSGAFPIRPPARSNTPPRQLQDACDRLSGGLAGQNRLSLEPTSLQAQSALLVRVRTVLIVSLAGSRRQFDRHAPGLLGRLLSDLRRAAQPWAPVFTPQTVLEDQRSADFEAQDELLYELFPRAFNTLTPGELALKLATFPKRDGARLLARHGYRTYLQHHEVGATLGLSHLFVPPADVPACIARLPAPLAHQAVRVRTLTARIQALRTPTELDVTQLDDDEDCWGHLIHPAFLVINSLDATNDPVAESLNEMWQQACEYGDTWPLQKLPWNTPAERQAAARSVARVCTALRLTDQALRAVGGVEA